MKILNGEAILGDCLEIYNEWIETNKSYEGYTKMFYEWIEKFTNIFNKWLEEKNK